MSDLDCNELVELVTAFLDHSLDAETERRVLEHLTLCDSCNEYVDQFQQTIRLLGDLPPEHLSDARRNELLNTFRSLQE
jgi:predicted anti-sigma-YlaC factor YlaD